MTLFELTGLLTRAAQDNILTPLVQGGAALIAFIGVGLTIYFTRKNQAHKQAHDAYAAYLKDCFEYPMLANGQLINQGFHLPFKYKEGSKEFYRYEWLVARLLSAAEQILETLPTDAEWRKTVKAQVSKHSRYIQKSYFHPEIYSEALQAIIVEVIDGHRENGHRESGTISGMKDMKMHGEKHRLSVNNSDISGSLFDDVNLSGTTYENVNMAGGKYHSINLSGCAFDDCNMSGWTVHDVNLSGLRIDKANLAGASIVNGRMAGMTIDGIEVTELLACWHEHHPVAESRSA